MIYTNKENISLTMAVWLAANDGYDRKFNPKEFSATELLKPIRSIVLTRQLASRQNQGSVDVVDLVASRVGHSVHAAAEISWIEHREQAFKNLDLPKNLIDNLNINPNKPNEDNSNDIYIEQRYTRPIGNYQISGKFDFVVSGVVEDIKTTKTYNWINGSNDKKYAQQGSIYRWIVPQIITEDYCNIHYMFTDWKQHLMHGAPDYPSSPIKTRKLPLMSLEATETFILNIVQKVDSLMNVEQTELPQCTPEELWMNPSTWKWFKGGKVTARSTKNFPSYSEAVTHSGGVGLIVEHKANAKRCLYCEAMPVCTQAAQLQSEKRIG